MLMNKNLWHLVKCEEPKPTDAKDLAKWEDQCDQVRGLITKIVLNGLQVHIEDNYSPIEVWKTLASLFDKSDNMLT